MMDVSEIVDFYKNLLIIQYHDQPKAQATIALFVDKLWASGILFQIRDAFDVDTAIGVQLDIIGKYVGVDRFFRGQTLEGYFSLLPQGVTPDPTQVGFTTQSTFAAETSQTLIYADILSTTQALTDDAYRTLIKFKIILNDSNFSHQSIDQNLFNFFGTGIIADSRGDMEMVFFVRRAFYEITLIALQKGILPKPMGVGILYLIQEDEPFFGFTSYIAPPSPFILGFTDQAHYGTSVGKTLDYGDLVTV